MTNGSSGRDRGEAFLRVDTDSRLAIIQALKDEYSFVVRNDADDRRLHLIVAEYASQLHGAANLEDVMERLRNDLASAHQNDHVIERLIDAKVVYEHFFDAEPRFQIDGWSEESVLLASDLYSRSALEIAATVWFNGRMVAKEQPPISSVKPPPLQFDHRLLGRARYVLLSGGIAEHEPFFETIYPVIGVCGVNNAWMYLDVDDLDRFGLEILDYLVADWPEAARLIFDLDAPIADRPLGFESTRLASEALVRHLTIAEAAESILDRLIKHAKASSIDPVHRADLELSNLNKYIAEVLNVGFVHRPTIFDRGSVEGSASKLAARLVEFFQRRENVFNAWSRYVDYAKVYGVAMRDLSQESQDVRILMQQEHPLYVFTAASLRRTVVLLENGSRIAEIVDKLNYEWEMDRVNDGTVIRVLGPNSPVIVTKVGPARD